MSDGSYYIFLAVAGELGVAEDALDRILTSRDSGATETTTWGALITDLRTR